MNTFRTLLTHGVGFGDVALLTIRASVGGFFVVSGAHKLFNPTRRQNLRDTFTADGVRYAPMMYLVPLAELLGGLGVALGALTIFAAIGLAALCTGACALDGLKRIPAMHPLDLADRAGDLLYLPEVLYVLCLLAVISFGPGAYSLDALVWR
jgi:putative oxidoreductase